MKKQYIPPPLPPILRGEPTNKPGDQKKIKLRAGLQVVTGGGVEALA